MYLCFRTCILHAKKTYIKECAEAGGGFGASVASPAEGRDVVPGKRHLQEASFEDERPMSYEEKREVCAPLCVCVCLYVWWWKTYASWKCVHFCVCVFVCLMIWLWIMRGSQRCVDLWISMHLFMYDTWRFSPCTKGIRGVHIFMGFSIHAYIHAYTYTRTYPQTQTYTCTVHTFVYIHTRVHTYTDAYRIHLHTYTVKYIHMYTSYVHTSKVNGRFEFTQHALQRCCSWLTHGMYAVERKLEQAARKEVRFSCANHPRPQSENLAAGKKHVFSAWSTNRHTRTHVHTHTHTHTHTHAHPHTHTHESVTSTIQKKVYRTWMSLRPSILTCLASAWKKECHNIISLKNAIWCILTWKAYAAQHITMCIPLCITEWHVIAHIYVYNKVAYHNLHFSMHHRMGRILTRSR